MIRLLLRLTLPLIALFIGALTVIHAQTVQGDVRHFLLPAQGCAMPCWQGIQPGVTTLAQARANLDGNPWVEHVRVIERAPYTYLYWDWSARKPAFVGASGAFLPPIMWSQDGIIQLIFIPTALSYGEVSLLLGMPDRGSSQASYPKSLGLVNLPNTHHIAAYFGGKVSFDMQMVCPVNLERFWNAPVTITYSSPSLKQALPVTLNDDLAHWNYGRSCSA